ncbi:hypothetical protein LINPERPRIM_LOCUS24028 [Linum perenne]
MFEMVWTLRSVLFVICLKNQHLLFLLLWRKMKL